MIYRQGKPLHIWLLPSMPCTLACFWKNSTEEQWSATHLRKVGITRSSFNTVLGVVVLFQSYDYFSSGVSFFKIADSFRNLT